MEVAPKPKSEEERLQKLRNYQILDTLPEMEFDDLTKLASYICDTPIALVSLIDESRQWFKSKVGLEVDETPRDVAFCSHTILQEDVFVIPDSFKDKRFEDNPLAISAPNVRFYAGAPLRTDTGHKVGTLCVIDNKPRELSENQIEALRAIARQVVSQLEIRISKKNATDLLESKSTFFANMSHEVRTPLNGIIGFTSLLLDQNLQRDIKEKILYIEECSKSLLVTINDLLDLSKLDANKLEIENIPFDIKKTIQDSLSVFEAIALTKNINLEFNIEDDVPSYLLGDPTRIRQVLLNLVSNAIKFTEKGHVKLNVFSKKGIDEPGMTVYCQVVDTGIGISEEKISKIFHTFEQLDNSTARFYGGSGLGLSICEKLVELMKGKISVESKVGEGSTFCFSFKTEEATAKEASSLKKDYSERFTIKKKGSANDLKILIAEDNKMNKILLEKILKRLGYENIFMVENGQEAFEQYKKKDYDLVLMDMYMPVMNGIKAAKLIKEYDDNAKIYCVSANVFQKEKDAARDAGMTEFLQKPIDISKLAEKLDSLQQE